MASKIDLSPRCIRRPLQQHGSFSAKCGANGIAHHEAIAAASRVRTRIEIGGIRHRAIRGLISSAQGKGCGDAPTSEFGTKLPIRDIRCLVAIGGRPDMARTAKSVERVREQPATGSVVPRACQMTLLSAPSARDVVPCENVIRDGRKQCNARFQAANRMWHYQRPRLPTARKHT